MKKRYLIFLLTILLIPRVALAAPSASLSCRSAGTVTVGSTISVTISGSVSEEVMWDVTAYSNDESKLKIASDSRYISDSFSSSMSKTFKFRATDVGTVTVSSNASVSNYSGQKGNSSTSCSIKVVEKKEEKPKSSDNSLKSLEIEGTKFNFNKDTLEYNVEVLSDEKTKINVKAEVNDKTAKISGTGEKEVDLGINKIEVNVTAENGSVRTYVLNVTVSEKNPIIVKIDGKKYKILRKIDGIDMPDGYEKKSIKIKNKDVEVYYSSKTKYTLVALTNDNVTSLFIYKNNKYTRYSELTNSSLRLLVQKPNNKDIPYKYKKCTFNIDNNIVDGYELSSDSRFKLVYALNLDTNEKSFYLYDLDEKTFQRFYDEQVLIYIELVKKFKVGIVILGGLFAVLLMTIVCLFSVNHKTKKRINNYSFNEQKINKKEKNILDE